MQRFVDLSNLTLYRKLLKAGKDYPSVKQKPLYQDIRSLFREHREITDAKEIKEERKKAAMGIAHMEMFIEKSRELQEGHQNTPGHYESLNPKDENFIYF